MEWVVYRSRDGWLNNGEEGAFFISIIYAISGYLLSLLLIGDYCYGIYLGYCYLVSRNSCERRLYVITGLIIYPNTS
jgi:hypothetical protein